MLAGMSLGPRDFRDDQGVVLIIFGLYSKYLKHWSIPAATKMILTWKNHSAYSQNLQKSQEFSLQR